VHIGSIPVSDNRFLCPSQPSEQIWCQPFILLSSGWVVPFFFTSVMKRPEREADLSSESGEEFKNVGNCTSSFLHAFITSRLIIQRDKLTYL